MTKLPKCTIGKTHKWQWVGNTQQGYLSKTMTRITKKRLVQMRMRSRKGGATTMTNLYKIPAIQWQEDFIDDKRLGVTAITITHDYGIAKSMFDESKVMVSYYNRMTGKGEPYISCPTFDTIGEAKDWVENTHYPATLKKAGFEPSNELAQREQIIQAVNTLVAICYGASKSAGWWTELATGEPLKRNKGEMLMLMVSELAEAMEADRKSLNDDHLPQYDGVSVELADCMVRICDFVGGFGLKTAEAMADKIEYNANRADHKIENRLKDNGKKY